jgi:hypothetical protein
LMAVWLTFFAFICVTSALQATWRHKALVFRDGRHFEGVEISSNLTAVSVGMPCSTDTEMVLGTGRTCNPAVCLEDQETPFATDVPVKTSYNGFIANHALCTGGFVLLVQVLQGQPKITLSWPGSTQATALFDPSDVTSGTGRGFAACCEVSQSILYVLFSLSSRICELLWAIYGLENL